jgi:thiol-disulfide isomerase/thioredoxin
MRLRAALLAGFFSLAFCSLAAAQAPSAPAGEAIFETIERDFEGLPLADLAGKTWKVEDLSGKTWLVNLWATWCGPCMAELPHIEKLHQELEGRGAAGVLTLNFDKQVGRVQPFMERKGYTFPVLLAAAALDKYVKEGIPQNWLVDAKAKVRRKATGFDATHPERFVTEVKAGLEQLKKK